MAITGVARFLRSVIELPSFPVFCAYLLMVISSNIYKNYTKPLEFRRVMIMYNFCCSGLSMVTLLGFIYGVYDSGQIYLKAPTTFLTPVFYLYYLTKNIELLDTVFMVLRHKTRQISFLHIYHHSSMVILSNYAYKFSAWPCIAVMLGLNSMVHVVLYFYYGLSALQPGQPPSWKQRLTELQILQFFLDMVFAVIGYMYHGFCIYGHIYGFLMTYLFLNFYYQTYIKKRTAKSKLT